MRTEKMDYINSSYKLKIIDSDACSCADQVKSDLKKMSIACGFESSEMYQAYGPIEKPSEFLLGMIDAKEKKQHKDRMDIEYNRGFDAQKKWEKMMQRITKQDSTINLEQLCGFFKKVKIKGAGYEH